MTLPHHSAPINPGCGPASAGSAAPGNASASSCPHGTAGASYRRRRLCCARVRGVASLCCCCGSTHGPGRPVPSPFCASRTASIAFSHITPLTSPSASKVSNTVIAKEGPIPAAHVHAFARISPSSCPGAHAACPCSAFNTHSFPYGPPGRTAPNWPNVLLRSRTRSRRPPRSPPIITCSLGCCCRRRSAWSPAASAAANAAPSSPRSGVAPGAFSYR